MRSIIITLILWWDRLLRAFATATENTFAGFGQLIDKVINKEQEAPELTTQEKFRYYTGVLGYHQKMARDRGDLQTVEEIEDDLWEMAHAYKHGDLENYLWKKTQSDVYYDVQIDEETGETKLFKINKENGTKEELETGVAGKSADLIEVPTN